MTRRASLLLAVLLVSGCSVELQHDLSEEDANDIYVLLQKNNIDATKEKDDSGGNEIRYKVKVTKADVASAAELLRSYSLPRPKAPGLAAFRTGKGMIPTQTEERAMFIEALGGEVSNSLNRIPGVLEAHAIVMIPEVNDLTQPDKKPSPTASVLIKYRQTVDGRPPLGVDDVRRFVANAVPEMTPDKVTVLLTPAVLPEAEASPESRMVTILGLKMAKTSADEFKVMVLIAGLVVLGMAVFTTMNFMRAGASKAPTRPRARPPE